MIGYFPLGIAFGILMSKAGYNFIWSAFTSLFVYAGSLQMLMVSFFSEGTPISLIAVTALLLNSRHIFYGLSFVEKFRGYGFSKYFLIYGMSDESYSLLCSYTPEKEINEKYVHIFSTALIWIYWITFSILGGIIGQLITFNTDGIDFALTALFTVILVERIKASDSKLSAVISLISSVLCLAIFGRDSFLLPSLILTVAMLVAVKNNAICALCTFSERLLPFLVFRKGKLPNIIVYIGKYLPTAVILTLVVYCLREIRFDTASAFIPQLLSVAVTALLHLWKKNTLLSVAGGTACCMILIRWL